MVGARSRGWLIDEVVSDPPPEVVGWRARRLSSVEFTAHCVAVEACRVELAHDHADVFLAEVLFPVTRNRDHDAGFVGESANGS